MDPQRVRPLVLGILNATPDSFSDGGRHLGLDDALAHARRMVAAGADVVDVGGESTRPGAARVDADEERARVLPVVRALVAEGVVVSVDTMRAATAEASVAAGARIVNDVSGGLADPRMAAVVADAGVDYVAMHWRGHSDTMATRATYADVVGEVRDELRARVDALVTAGVDPARIVLDPGLGFAKEAAHDWQLLGSLHRLADLGHRVLVGASRKRFLGRLLPADAAVEDRDVPTAVVSALSARAGAWAVRVHDVASTRAALAVEDAWARGRADAAASAGASAVAGLSE
ncbi:MULTISPECIES: dihydropteroate synthase [Clavibacter]|uniref:Dihydropteroate synthase n=1 Tax=Clavibacter tessellarius TaxID=31965 RepID=A0A154V2F3_9MICO|nr:MULTISPECIES: dihydropteroate synthase [Clavibacter]KZC95563.1 dihydropteroate synthase [Clavibacter michiganensis subsp. tessellarius]MDA3806178.1 dihydropteroate synthase [Clavibacter sp. CT19]